MTLSRATQFGPMSDFRIFFIVCCRIVGAGEFRKRRAELLPLIYDEMRHSGPRQHLRTRTHFAQPFETTGLVHETYLRIGRLDADAVGRLAGHFWAIACYECGEF